jgi:DNA-directed RNA polymerase specialized sigma24 family protein
MTLNATNSAWRAEQRATRGKEPADEPAPSDYLAEPTMPADDYVALKQVLHRAEGLLAPQDIALLRLLLDGRHLSAAAKELQISYSNAAVRLHRAKKTIRNLLISKE